MKTINGVIFSYTSIEEMLLELCNFEKLESYLGKTIPLESRNEEKILQELCNVFNEENVEKLLEMIFTIEEKDEPFDYVLEECNQNYDYYIIVKVWKVV